ncbi:sulfatase [Aggregatimonas sangjinii]|uniref:Sulfatase n=1 Tax=Aggregatimonas sangjinii TaxID=2583587 RepID=A0A5B7SXA4_9FLAO|nr:sulfatase [Aggregatimonas sangjinii]QCX01374.1 sulfatase [Aggregatimonas sangjinii]
MTYFKTCLYVVLLFVLGCKSTTKEEKVAERTTTRPNIIFILADDYGIMDSQAYAHKFTDSPTSDMFYETPNIDRLIHEGVAFSQAYANQLCSPTRASILTGKFASRMGFTTAMPPRPTYYNQNLPAPQGYLMHDVLEHKDDIKIEQALINGTSNSAVSAGTTYDAGRDELSLAEALTDYHSAFIGKWHIGGFGANGYQPADQGFEPLAWYDAGGSDYFDWRKSWDNTSTAGYPKIPQEKMHMGNSGQETGANYLTDDLTLQALNFIEESSKSKTRPFFLYFSHFAVHAPYEGKSDEVTYFEEKPTKGWNGHKDPVYAAMVKSMDRSVGAILDKLEETGLDENTLVVFMSDNGGIDSSITPNDTGTDNSPFLGGKACLTEGGIRVPLLFRWKNKIKEGQWVDTPVDCTDIFPTLLEAAGYDSEAISKKNSLDGQSMFTVLSDVTNSKNSYTKKVRYWHYPFNVIYNSPFEPFALTPHSAIRDGNHKLIFDWYGRLHLYDIETDPFEKNDLAETRPELRNKLFEKLMEWLSANVAQRYWPALNPSYNPEKEARGTPFVNLFETYRQNQENGG